MKTKITLIGIFLILINLSMNAQTISTIGLGYRFTSAVDIARDYNGNLYACDNIDNAIYKIEPNNKTTIISAGNGKPGAIAVDNLNNLLYVCYESPETNGGKVFKMNFDGSNSQLFSSPNVAIVKMNVSGFYLWFTASGNNNHLGKIALSDGSVSYSSILPTTIQAACDFTFDSNGNSYFVFANSSTILKIDSTLNSYTSINADTNRLSIDYCLNGNFLITCGIADIKIIGTNGLLVASYFNPMSPTGGLMFPMAIEGKEYQTMHIIYQSGASDGFYLLDYKYPDDIFTYRGTKFNSPIGLTTDNNNNIYITSKDPLTDYNQVNKVNITSLNALSISHLYNTTNLLAGISYNFNNNLLYFADKTANSIKYVNLTGTSSGDHITGLTNPYLYKNTSNSTDYYTQSNYSYLIKRTISGFPPQTNYSYLGALNNAKGFDFDNSGNVYVADSGTNYIQKINISSGTSTNLGIIGNNFNMPSNVAVDSEHNLIYIADTEHNAIARMNLNGDNIMTLSNNFNKPEGICLDATKTKLYVADTGNNVVKILDLTSFLSISDISNESGFKIFPNPATDFVQIQNSKNTEVEKLKLFDINGRLIKEFSNFIDDKIDIRNLSKGIYFINVNSDNRSQSFKIIKN